MKLRTLCIVRKSDAFEDTKAWLEFLGAARVFCYEDVVADELKREHSSLPKLAFDGVGGSSSLVLAWLEFLGAARVFCYEGTQVDS